jgi:F-type H+-transporting ATPase subunit epsilon
MLKLEIVTPEKKVLDEPVDSVTVPTATGEIGILPNHAPLISALKPGILSYTSKGATDKLVISGGFVEVSHDQVAILTDVAERADEIDTEAAKTDREAAEKALAAAATAPVEEMEAEKERLEKAEARLQLAAGR